MSKLPLSPGEGALADQMAAEAADRVAILTQSVRAGDAKHGEAQNLANFIAYLSDLHPAPYLAALVVAAVRQIPEYKGD